MILIKPHQDKVFIGLDLAWGEKNASGFAVLDEKGKLLEYDLLFNLEAIRQRIHVYKNDFDVYLGVDAPLYVENESGNRQIEKEFCKDFSQYKISMLPVNRKIMTKYTKVPRGEALRLSVQIQNLYEVYPHSTIAVLFNNYKILPYKRKTGRKKVDIIKALSRYQNFLKSVVLADTFLDYNLKTYNSKQLKDYEDILDAVTAAYTLLYCQNCAEKCKKYRDKEAVFITPI